MLTQNILKNDMYFKYHKELEELTKPLAEYFQITYFAHKISYPDNSKIYLGNSPLVHESYYFDHWRKTSPLEGSLDKFQTGYYLYSSFNQPVPDVIEYYKSINIGNVLVIIKNYDTYCEFFFFGSSWNNVAINNFYFNNIDLLENFILNYREQTRKLYQRCDKQRILLSTDMVTNNTSIPGNVSDELKKRFLQDINYLPTTGKRVEHLRLSKQQHKCADLLLSGKSAKSISEELNLSKRTVEYYLELIKTKFNCNNKTELIIKLKDLKN